MDFEDFQILNMQSVFLLENKDTSIIKTPEDHDEFLRKKGERFKKLKEEKERAREEEKLERERLRKEKERESQVEKFSKKVLHISSLCNIIRIVKYLQSNLYLGG